MNPLQQLSEYLRRLERNLRLLTLARGSAILCGAALAVTIAARPGDEPALVFGSERLLFARIILFFIAGRRPQARAHRCRCCGSIRSAWRVKPRRRHPELGERLLTFVERRHANDPFLPLLAADSLSLRFRRGSRRDRRSFRAPWPSVRSPWSPPLLLLWLGMRGPGYFGYGTSLLWGVSEG